MRVFKIDLSSVLLKFIIASLLLTIVMLLLANTYNFVVYVLLILLIIGLEFLIFFMTATLVKIEITGNNVRLYIRTFLMVLNVKTVSLDNFQYSFREEIGAKGVKSDELRFYENYIKIIGIGRGFDGWTKKRVLQILNDFEELEIKKID